MKIQYKSITGRPVSEKQSESCRGCCFYSQKFCIPYDVFQCSGTIFEETKNDIFKT